MGDENIRYVNNQQQNFEFNLFVSSILRNHFQKYRMCTCKLIHVIMHDAEKVDDTATYQKPTLRQRYSYFSGHLVSKLS